MPDGGPGTELAEAWSVLEEVPNLEPGLLDWAQARLTGRFGVPPGWRREVVGTPSRGD